MCETWVAIVRRDSNSLAAISGFDNPASTSAAILISVGVRLSHPLGRLTVLRVRPAADAVRAEARLQPGHVSGGTERAIDLHRTGERRPGLPTVVGADELPSGRLQRLRTQQRPAGLVVAFRSG